MASREFMLERFFHYMPSEGAAGFFLVAFAVIGAINVYQTVRWAPHTRYIYFMAITAFMEAVGYAARLVAIAHPTLGSFITMTFFLIIPPIMLAVVNYALLGELVRAVNVRVWMPPRLIAKAFLGSDVVCFFLQSAGGGTMVSTDPDTASMGKNLVFVGLAVQLVFFTIFTAMSIKASTMPELAPATSKVPRVRAVWWLIWGTMVLLYARNIYRVVEFAYVLDPTNYVTRSEWLFFVCDAVLIALACIAYSIWHPGVILGAEATLTALVRGTPGGAVAPISPAIDTPAAVELTSPAVNPVTVTSKSSPPATAAAATAAAAEV